MIPAAVAIERSRIESDPEEFFDVHFEVMPRWMRMVVSSRVEGVTLGRRILLDPVAFEQVVVGLRPDIVSHELVHTTQWRVDGAKFPLRYVFEYLMFRLIGVAHDAAYRSISYEIDAFRVGSEQRAGVV